MATTTEQSIIHLIEIGFTKVVPRKTFNPPVSVKIAPELKHSFLQSLWIYSASVEGDKMFVELPDGHELSVEQVCKEYQVDGGSQAILDAIHRKFLHEQSGISEKKSDRLPASKEA